MLDFCVAIRAYNAERYLPEILDALRVQQNLENVQWEVLIVDNCSTDRTAEIVRQYQSEWIETVPLRYCYESRQGSSFARRRAIEEANAPLVGFLDDDNEPGITWVRDALDFAKNQPQAAAFGSQIHGKFETSPPQGFNKIAGFMPVVERQTSVCFTKGRYNRLNMMPPGAGLVIRKQPWLENVPQDLVLRGPVGNSLAKKGEDIEALLYIKKAGWEIWFNADMHIYHHIPSSRFEREYLLRFFKGIGLSKAHTRSLLYAEWQRPLITGAYMANDFRKMVRHLFRHKTSFRDELATACEFQLLWYSFVSPLHTFTEKIEVPFLNDRKTRLKPEA